MPLKNEIYRPASFLLWKNKKVMFYHEPVRAVLKSQPLAEEEIDEVQSMEGWGGVRQEQCYQQMGAVPCFSRPSMSVNYTTNPEWALNIHARMASGLSYVNIMFIWQFFSTPGPWGPPTLHLLGVSLIYTNLSAH